MLKPISTRAASSIKPMDSDNPVAEPREKRKLNRNLMRDSDNKSFVKIDKNIDFSKERRKLLEKRYKSPYVMTNPKFNLPIKKKVNRFV